MNENKLVISVEELEKKFLDVLLAAGEMISQGTLIELAKCTVPYIQRQTPEEPKLISVEELQEKFISYFQDLPLWGSYKNMSSALVNIAAPYIRQKEEPAAGDEESLQNEIAWRLQNALNSKDLFRDQAREIIRLVSASKDAEIERLKINHKAQCGRLILKAADDRERADKIEAELSVFKEGMRAIKSALDFIQSN